MRLKNAISLTNNYIAETHGNTSMFATIFFGILDSRTGVLMYVNGGHLPPMLINQQGIKETLKLTGPAVGVAPGADYGVSQVVLEPGDTLFAYTDGITDAVNPAGEYFSVKGLVPLFVGNQALSTLLEQIIKEIEFYSPGAQQTDDITMLAVRRKEK